MFPNGEDFFVDSVRNYRGLVDDDPDLKGRVKGFIGQESMHGREHRILNERLEALGYPTAAYDARLLRRANWMRRRVPKAVQLSVTAASEHFTSVLAHAVLSDEQTRATLFPSPEFELLITWHALEELEHKDVAFDVLQRANGTMPFASWASPSPRSDGVRPSSARPSRRCGRTASTSRRAPANSSGATTAASACSDTRPSPRWRSTCVPASTPGTSTPTAW